MKLTKPVLNTILGALIYARAENLKDLEFLRNKGSKDAVQQITEGQIKKKNRAIALIEKEIRRIEREKVKQQTRWTKRDTRESRVGCAGYDPGFMKWPK